MRRLIGTGVRAGRNQQQEVAAGGNSEMVAVVGHEFIAQGVEARRHRLSTVITRSPGEMQHPNQGGFRQIVNAIGRGSLGQGCHLFAKPQINRSSVAIESDAVSRRRK